MIKKITKKTCTMKSTEKSLLYEIKEDMRWVKDTLANHKERADRVDSQEENQDGKINSLENAVEKLINYFRIRNEIKNWIIGILIAMVSFLATFAFNIKF